MSEAVETLKHIGFSRLVLFLQRLGGERLLGVHVARNIEQDENFHPQTDLLNLPVYRWFVTSAVRYATSSKWRRGDSCGPVSRRYLHSRLSLHSNITTGHP